MAATAACSSRPARILTPIASDLTVAPAALSDAIHYPSGSSSGSQEQWVLPVNITYSCTKKSTTQGPFWLALNTDRSALLNADPTTGAEPGTPAYVSVRTGTAPATGPVTLGGAIATMECQSSPGPLTLTTYLEFSRPPTAADLAGLTLLGAPDGTSDFIPWNPADISQRRPAKRRPLMLPTTTVAPSSQSTWLRASPARRSASAGLRRGSRLRRTARPHTLPTRATTR